MTETETRRNHERSYNKYYTMPSREELHRGYSGHLCESDFNIARGKNQFDSNVAKKLYLIGNLMNIVKRNHVKLIIERSKTNNGKKF